MAIEHSLPWYREPWPWLVMSGPAIVVVAGTLTAVVAFRTADGVVADDYYKQGLAINRVIERGAQARLLGIGASAQFDAARDEIAVTLASKAPLQPRLRLTLVHPTRAGTDHSVWVTREADGRYTGRVDASRASSWIVSIEDEQATWRIGGRWTVAKNAFTLTPAD
jgi:uncharacterized protein